MPHFHLRRLSSFGDIIREATTRESDLFIDSMRAEVVFERDNPAQGQLSIRFEKQWHLLVSIGVGVGVGQDWLTPFGGRAILLSVKD